MKHFIKILFLLCFCSPLISQEQIGEDILGFSINDDFGSGLAINADGTIIAIGAMRRNSGTGIIEVYRNENGQWKLMGNKIDGATDNSWFGVDVELTPSGYRMIVGSYKESVVKVYDFFNNEWILTGEIFPETNRRDTHFGYAIDISEDGKTIGISATHAPQGNVHRGKVNIYRYENSQWLKIGQSIEGEFDGDAFGWDIDLSENGNTVAIGSIENDFNGEDAGQVKVFSFDNTSWNQVGQSLHGEKELLGFGFKLSMTENGRFLIVGAPRDWTGDSTEYHYAQVFELINGLWVEKGDKILGLKDVNMGYDVEISEDGNRVAISAPQLRNCPIQIWDFKNSNWEFVGSISHDAQYNNLGFSIAMTPDGETLVGSSSSAGGFAVVYSLLQLDKPECIIENTEEEEEEEPEPNQQVVTSDLYIPNIIASNSQSIENSVLYAQAANNLEYSLQVFDRWGNLIFRNDQAVTNVIDDGWQPTQNQEQGVYVYLINYQIQEKVNLVTGDVTLTK